MKTLTHEQALRALLKNFQMMDGRMTVPIDDMDGNYAVDPYDILNALESIEERPPNYDYWIKNHSRPGKYC